MSSCDKTLHSPLRPVFFPNETAEPAATQHLIKVLKLQKHVEGGYFAETDRDIRRVPNPFSILDPHHPSDADLAVKHDGSTRSASTTIFYMISPGSPLGAFHRNKGRTVHTLHQGRGRYVIIHADEVKSGQKARVETFVVGHDIVNGEKLQWIVEGGKFKASFLLPDREDGKDDSRGLLISETVVPGFEFEDHDFMESATLTELVTAEQRDEMKWLLRNTE